MNYLPLPCGLFCSSHLLLFTTFFYPVAPLFYNLLIPLPPFHRCRATFRSLRTSIIDLVLATDMAKHFEHLTKFNVTAVSVPSLMIVAALRLDPPHLHCWWMMYLCTLLVFVCSNLSARASNATMCILKHGML